MATISLMDSALVAMNLSLAVSAVLGIAAWATGIRRHPRWAQGFALVAGVLALEMALEKLYGVPSDPPNPIQINGFLAGRDRGTPTP